MKKLFLLFLLFFKLYAITAKEAINLYKQKKYKEAYIAILQLLEKDNYSSKKLNFYFALSAEKTGHFKEALGAIERLLIYNPDNVRLLLERAKIYFLLKNYNLSQNYFLELRKIVDKQTQKEINKFLDAIKKLQKKDFLSFTLIAGIGYDSNINNTSENSRWNLYFGNIILPVKNSQNIKSSQTLNQTLAIKYTHKFENAKLDNNFVVTSKQYISSHNKDFTMFQYSPNYSFLYKKLLFNTALTYGYLIYGNNHYLSLYGIKQDIKYRYKNYLNTTTFKIDNKIYKNSLQNATLYSISNNIDMFKKSNKFSLLLGIDKNHRHKGYLSTINYYDYKMGLTSAKIVKNDMLKANILYEYIKYKDKYSIFNKYQKDKKLTINLSLTKKLKHFIIQPAAQIIRNNSNIPAFDYSKWSVNLNFIKTIKE